MEGYVDERDIGQESQHQVQMHACAANTEARWWVYHAGDPNWLCPWKVVSNGWLGWNLVGTGSLEQETEGCSCEWKEGDVLRQRVQQT